MSNSGVSIKDLLRLYRLSKKRFNSPVDYQVFEQVQGELLVKYLSKQNLSLSGAKVLDVGFGFGGYSRALLDVGAYVTGLDLSVKLPIDGLNIACGNAVNLPFVDDSFDLLVCISLIEHVSKPDMLIKEMIRVVKPGGYLYIGFPPFFAPNGGHHFSPYHLLGEKTAVTQYQKRKWHVNDKWTNEPYDFPSDSYAKAFGGYGLYPLTIAKLRKLLKENNLTIVDQSVKYFGFNVSKIPLLGELLTWHIQFLIKRTT